MNTKNIYRGVKRKQKSLSITEKVELLKKLNGGMSVRRVCELYGVGSWTVYDLKKPKGKLLSFFVDRVCVFFFFFFRLLPILGRHSAKLFSYFSRSTSSPSLAPTLSMFSLAKYIHLLLGLPLFLLPRTAISIIVFPT